MKISVLIENTTSDGAFAFEHGFSLFVQTDDGSFLIDGGQSGDFVYNAARMNINISAIEKVVLSHNHIDHAGGLTRFFENNLIAKLYMRAKAQEDYYYKLLLWSVCISQPQEFFEHCRERIVFTYDKFPLLPNVFLCFADNGEQKFQNKNKRLFKKNGDKLVLDDFRHEQYVVVRKGGRINIISPCSHTGIINIINDAKSKFPDAELGSFVGGLHLIRLSSLYTLNCGIEYLNDILAELKKTGLKKLYTGHCTGMRAFDLMKMQMGENLAYISTGETIEIE